MLETIKTLLLIIILIYAVIMTVLYWKDYTDKENYQKAKDDSLNRRDDELKRRESIVVDKEICFRELTKLKTIVASASDILKMYSIPTPQISQISQLQTASLQSKESFDASSLDPTGTNDSNSSIIKTINKI